MSKEKETSGVELGDKIKVSWEDWEENKTRKATGVVFAIDHNSSDSDYFATFHFNNYKGAHCWFFGVPDKIISKGNKLPKDTTI